MKEHRRKSFFESLFKANALNTQLAEWFPKRFFIALTVSSWCSVLKDWIANRQGMTPLLTALTLSCWCENQMLKWEGVADVERGDQQSRKESLAMHELPCIWRCRAHDIFRWGEFLHPTHYVLRLRPWRFFWPCDLKSQLNSILNAACSNQCHIGNW